MNAILNGNFTLSQTLATIQRSEAFGFVLTALSQADEKLQVDNSDVPANYATFSPGPAPPKDLDLVEVTDVAGLSGLLSTRSAGGWGLVAFATIFAEGKPVSVAAFRHV